MPVQGACLLACSTDLGEKSLAYIQLSSQGTVAKRHEPQGEDIAETTVKKKKKNKREDDKERREEEGKIWEQESSRRSHPRSTFAAS